MLKATLGTKSTRASGSAQLSCVRFDLTSVFVATAVVAFAVAVMLAGTVSSAFALDTATWSAASPAAGATVVVKPTSVWITATDNANITAATVKMNGAAASSVSRSPASGSKVVKVTGTFSASMIRSGVNTITTTVTSASGVSTNIRTFTLGTATVITSVSPAAGATLSASPATITANVTSSYTSFTSTMTVDGGIVPTVYALGTFTRTVSPALAVGNHTVAFTVTDAGGTTSKTWTFKVSPPMSDDGECTACHTTYPGAHTVVTTGCAKCHDHAYAAPGNHGGAIPTVAGCIGTACHKLDHTGGMGWGSGPFSCAFCHSATYPAVPRHTDASNTVAHVTSTPEDCGVACHLGSLITEHGKYPTGAPIKYQCTTCHSASARAEVKTAITTKSNACDACHGGVDHVAVHAKTTSAFCAKAGCHPATNLIGEHITTPINPNGTLSCATCHSSTKPVVVSAIAGRDKNCTTCHGQMLSGHDAMHVTVMDPECLHCHAGSISAEHIVLHNTGGTRTCSRCHDSTEPWIVTAIANGDRTCSGCHADAGHNVGHASDFAGQDCGGCHVANVQDEHFKPTSSSATARCANCHAVDHSTAVDALNGATWNKGCAQGSCHVVGTATEKHLAMGTAHAVPTPSPTCIASDCHAGTDLSAIHSAATTVTLQGTRSGCGVCHSAGALPSTKECITCHPDRAVAHGFDALKHTSTETCFGTCHQAQLKANHDALPAPVTCSHCHILRDTLGGSWDKTCSACHATIAHATANHAGTDAAVRAANTRAQGCSDSLPVQDGCHDISNLATLHLEAPGSCLVCHGAGKTPTRECLTCHPTGSSGGGAATETTLAAASYYHHNNVKYLIVSADATPNPYYYPDSYPPGGWYDSAYYNDCSDFCHVGYGGSPAVFRAYSGTRMWFSAPGGGGWYGPSIRTLTSAAATLPAGAYLDFMTDYVLNHGWGNGSGRVELSTNGGGSWTPLTGTVGGASTSLLTGASAGWVSAHYDLAAYAGQHAQVRFRFDDGGGFSTGWALDDIVFGGSDGPFFSDGAETKLPEWTSSYWIRSNEAFTAF